MERFSAPVLKVAMLSALIGLAIIAARAGGVPYLSVELVLTVGAGILLLIVAYEIWMRQLSELFRYRLQKEEALNPEPVMVSDADGAIVFANKAAKDLLDARASVTIDGALADYLVSAKNIVFQLTQRLVDEHWVKETHSNRLYDVDIVARTLSHGFIYWRLGVRQNSLDQLSIPTERALKISIGRNGAILSAPLGFCDVLGQRPAQLSAVLSPSDVSSSGFYKLKTPSGELPCFLLVGEPRAGRRDINLFLGPSGDSQGENLFGLLPLAMLRLSSAGVVLEANEAAEELLTRSDLHGESVEKIFSDVGQPIETWFAQTLDDPKAKRSEYARLATSADEKYVQVALQRVETAEGPQILAYLTDATELKSLEAQFVQSQKMQAIGQLAGGVAHDFNNLLTAISGHCDLLILRHGESDPDYRDLDQIRQNSNRAAALVGQLLAFSRKQTLQTQSLDLEQVLSDHTHLLNRLVGEKTQLTLTHGHKMKSVRADKRQLEQVIMNLVVNARDAMGGVGEIAISTEMKTLTQPELKDRAKIPAGEYCMIKITDQGCGISPEKLPRIFEPFYTSKKTGEGTGLGLSTVYGIVKQTGGFIFVDSAVGVGSTFEVLFPAERVRAPEKTQAEVTKQSDCVDNKSSGVVLLVEDEAPVRAFASRALQLKGFSVIEAASAEDALDILKDDALMVDVFVTDVVMPGVDGPTWVNQALQKRPSTKVVFVSGYAENRCDQLADNIPNAVFLPKPFSLSQLTSTVANLH
jgi:two-component system cell cycle sensor histidine kinase/response regulator CckA